MIIGYLILDESGNPLISRELISIVSGQHQMLFSNLIKAVCDVMGEVFQTRLRHVELENHHLYFSFGEKYSVVLVSDMDDDRLLKLSANVVKALNEKLKLDSMAIQLNEDARRDIQKVIDEIIFGSPPSILSIKRLAESILGILDTNKGEYLGLREVKPRIYRPGFFDRLKKIFPRSVPTQEILEDYYKGNLWGVFTKTEALFNDDKYGDLARILHVKAALNLNSFDPKVEAPELSKVKNVIERISDTFAREYLMAELQAFLDIGSYNRRRELLLQHQSYIFEKLASSDDIINTTYAILINPLPYEPLLDYLEKKFKGKSDYLYALALEMRTLLKILTGAPKSIEEVFSLMGKIKSRFEQAYKGRKLSAHSYFHVLQFTLVWGLIEKTLTIGDGSKLLKMFFENFKKYREDLIEKGLYSTNRHKAVNLYFAFNIILRILLELERDSAKDLVEQYIKYIAEKTRWFLGLGKTKRIMRDMYYVALAGSLSILTRLAIEKNKFYRDIIELVIELANPRMQDFWKFNEYHFAHYYVDLLEIIGNTALFIDLENVRKNILRKVAFGIEKISKMFRDTPIIHDIEIIKAIRFYLLSGTSLDIDRAKKLLNELKNTASPFINKLAEIIFENYEVN